MTQVGERGERFQWRLDHRQPGLPVAIVGNRLPHIALFSLLALIGRLACSHRLLVGVGGRQGFTGTRIER
ncbi:hypothetical protein D9M68_959340 [compost metagenome]